MIGWVESDLARYEREQETWNGLVCDKCGEPIPEDAYLIDGDHLCEECARDWLDEQKVDARAVYERSIS